MSLLHKHEFSMCMCLGKHRYRAQLLLPVGVQVMEGMSTTACAQIQTLLVPRNCGYKTNP